MKISITALIFALTIFTVSDLFSRPGRESQIPNGSKYVCQSCHVSPGGGSRNPFGKDVGETLQNGRVRWDLIFNLDSDGDGRTNGEELLDPDGTWAQGQVNPGNSEDVTHPGVSDQTSVEDITNNIGTNLYPLPANDNLTLEFFSENVGFGTLSVVNLNGNKLFTKSEYTKYGKNDIDLNIQDISLNQGVYFLIFRNEFSIIKKKFIVQ